MYVPLIRTTAERCLRPSEISASNFFAIVSAELPVSRLRFGNVCTEDLKLLNSVWPQTLLSEEQVERV